MSKPKIRKKYKADPEKSTGSRYIKAKGGKLNGGTLIEEGDTSSSIVLSAWKCAKRWIHILIPFSTCKIQLQAHLPATLNDGWEDIEGHLYDIQQSDILYSFEFKPELYKIRLKFKQLSSDQIAPFVFITTRK